MPNKSTHTNQVCSSVKSGLITTLQIFTEDARIQKWDEIPFNCRAYSHDILFEVLYSFEQPGDSLPTDVRTHEGKPKTKDQPKSELKKDLY